MKISRKDWAQLSAYLDSELSQKESKKLQARIEKDPVLQVALEDLQILKKTLAGTPRLKVPRNFRLTPMLAGVPRRYPVDRGYRLAAAALSILLIGVVVLDLGSLTMKGSMPAGFAPQAEEVMMDAASEQAADAVEEIAVLEAVEEESAPAAEFEEHILEEAASEPDAAVENFGAEESGETESLAEAETKAAPQQADRAVGGETDETSEGSQDSDSEPLLTGEPVPGEVFYSPDENEIPKEALVIPWTRILEIALGLGAIGFGVAAWIKRKRAA